MAALFACANCHGRFPYEDLNEIDYLCKGCQKLRTTCSHCRDEFHLESKYSKESICKRCAHYVEKYGTPASCKYCNLLAAFVGSKCERCSNQEKKFGPPKNCEQCQQRSAFLKPDKLLEHKVLCWLCARSYKRLLSSSVHKAKSKRVPPVYSSSPEKRATNLENRSSTPKRHKPERADFLGHVRTAALPNHKSGRRPSAKSHARGGKTLRAHANSDHVNNGSPTIDVANESSSTASKLKKGPPRHFLTSLRYVRAPIPIPHLVSFANYPRDRLADYSYRPTNPPDTGNSDQFLMINQMTEEVASLKKQMAERNRMLLDKDKKIGEIKAQHFEAEKDFRIKIQSMQKDHRESFESLQAKNRDLQKQISQLTKERRGGKGIAVVGDELNKTPNIFLSVESPRSNSPFVL